MQFPHLEWLLRESGPEDAFVVKKRFVLDENEGSWDYILCSRACCNLTVKKIDIIQPCCCLVYMTYHKAQKILPI